MKDPVRLMDEEPAGFEASLIRAGRREEPSLAARRAMAAACGVTVAVALAPKASAASSTLKPIAVMCGKGFLVGALVVGGVVLTPRIFPERHGIEQRIAADAVHSKVPRTRAPVDPGPTVVVPAPTAETTLPAPSIAQSDGAPAARPSIPQRGAPARAHGTVPTSPGDVAVSATPADGLAEEIQAFERARRAFASGNVAVASQELDAYQRQFAHGTLSLEAEVLRIETLAAKGDLATARERATGFLAANPSAPAARRVRSVLARIESGAGR